jgi:Domain of Unknown Function (DUF1206)
MRSTAIPRAERRARRASRTRAAHLLARAGLTARGIIYILIGWVAVLVAIGQRSHEADQKGISPGKSGGIDKALLTLRDQPFGPVLLLAAALGLVVFGIYGLCEARWRRV